MIAPITAGPRCMLLLRPYRIDQAIDSFAATATGKIAIETLEFSYSTHTVEPGTGA